MRSQQSQRSQYRETVPGDPNNPVIIYNDPDNGDIAVTTFPAPGWTVEDVVAKDINAVDGKWYVISERELPRQIFRNAWRLINGRLEVDYMEARQTAISQCKDMIMGKLYREHLLLPDEFLTAEEKAARTDLLKEYQKNMERVKTAISVEALYVLQDEGILFPEAED